MLLWFKLNNSKSTQKISDSEILKVHEEFHEELSNKAFLSKIHILDNET